MSRADGRARPRLSVRRYRRGRRAVAALGLAAGGLALAGRWMLGAPFLDGDRWVGTLLVVAAAAALVVLIVLLLGRYGAKRDRLVALVRQERPGAAVVPAYSSRDLRADAVAAGVATHGIARKLTTTLVLALVGDDAEVWIRGDRGPRWSVRLTAARVELREIDMGQSRQLGLRIADGTRSVSFVPHYRGLSDVGSVERALSDLGEEPADHLEP